MENEKSFLKFILSFPDGHRKLALMNQLGYELLVNLSDDRSRACPTGEEIKQLLESKLDLQMGTDSYFSPLLVVAPIAVIIFCIANAVSYKLYGF